MIALSAHPHHMSQEIRDDRDMSWLMLLPMRQYYILPGKQRVDKHGRAGRGGSRKRRMGLMDINVWQAGVRLS